MSTPPSNTPPATPPNAPSDPSFLYFKRLIESLPDYIYFKDLQGRFIALSKTLAVSFGLSRPEQAIGKTDFDFFEKSLARQKFDDEQNIIRTGLGFVGKEERATTSQGGVRWVLTSKQPLRGADGKIIGTFGISRDITEAKNAKEALEAHHRLLEILIDLLPCQIFVKDDEGRIRLTNITYREAIGAKSAADIEGRRLDQLTNDPRASRVAAEDEQILEQGLAILNREEFDASPTALNRWTLLSKVPLRDTDGHIQGIVGMAADITRQKEAEARALQAQHDLEVKNQQMQAELHLASQLQTELMASSMHSVRDMLDPQAPFVPGIGFHYEPCEFLAGDFFHAVPGTARNFDLLICDVMGHGVKAALVTTLIRGLLADVRSKNLNPAQALEHVNERLCPLLDRPPMPRFVTALYGRVDLDQGTIDLASAGHPWPLLQRRGTETATISNEPCGPALGYLRGVKYTSSLHQLAHGDRLIFHTDGWTEEPNQKGEEYGTPRLIEALARHRDNPVEKVLGLIATEISAFSGRTVRGDDLCAVLLEL